jgi:hypothetical protein
MQPVVFLPSQRPQNDKEEQPRCRHLNQSCVRPYATKQARPLQRCAALQRCAGRPARPPSRPTAWPGRGSRPTPLQGSRSRRGPVHGGARTQASQSAFSNPIWGRNDRILQDLIPQSKLQIAPLYTYIYTHHVLRRLMYEFLCIMMYVLHIMYYVLCTMYYALCTTHYV